MSAPTLNLNDRVNFRMTPAGRHVWRQSIAALGLDLARHEGIGRESDGSFTWPLWEVMQVFGPRTFHGMPRTLIEGNALRLVDACAEAR